MRDVLVDAVLPMFSDLGLLMTFRKYFPHLDPKEDVVILDPQWLVDTLCLVIRDVRSELHKVELDDSARRDRPHEFSLLRDRGLLVPSLLRHYWPATGPAAVREDEYRLCVQLLLHMHLAMPVTVRQRRVGHPTQAAGAASQRGRP